MNTENFSKEAAASCPFSAGMFDPLDLSDPFPILAQAQADAPIFFDEHIGYWVVPEARGQGVASAAVTALIPWALAPDLGGLTRLVADVDPQNAASIAVLRRAGFVALAGSDAPPCRPGGQPGLTFGLAVPPRPPAT